MKRPHVSKYQANDFQTHNFFQGTPPFLLHFLQKFKKSRKSQMLSTFAQKYPSTYNPPHFLNEGTNIILPQPPGCAIRDKAYCSVSL